MAKIPDSLKFASSGFPRAFSWGLGTLAEHRALNVPQTGPRDFLGTRERQAVVGKRLGFPPSPEHWWQRNSAWGQAL